MMTFLKTATLPLALLSCVPFTACNSDTGSQFTVTGGSIADGGGGTDNGGGANGGMGGQSSAGGAADPAPTLGGPCTGDKDCRAISALCDPASHACVECQASTDCGSSAECVAGACVSFTACESSLTCSTDEVCDKSLGRCVECAGDNDCGGDQVCLNSVCSTTCSSDKDCTAGGQVCDLGASACVDCVLNADCSDGMRCSEHACLPALCDQGQGKCAGDLLLSCNGEGTGYQQTTCDRGCDAGELMCNGAPDDEEGCDPRVRILVQRSGTMFEQPSSENNWWNAVAAAFDPDDSDLLSTYAGSIKLSLSTFHMVADDETCPVLSTKQNVSTSGVSDFFATEASAHETYVDSATKVDAPLPEAIAQAAAELGDSGERYLLLVIAGLPDSCTVQDGFCAIDPSIAQLQETFDAGIRTKLLYIDAQSSGLIGFAEAAANAGAGLGVQELETGCDSNATYSDSAGNAGFENPGSVSEVKAALSALLADIKTCN